jgi:hypothetical protein
MLCREEDSIKEDRIFLHEDTASFSTYLSSARISKGRLERPMKDVQC